MSRFFVGQLVRVIDSDYHKYLIGEEARIVGLDCEFVCVNSGLIKNGYIELDLTVRGGIPFFTLPNRIEPILPEGHRACDEYFKRDLDNLLAKEEGHASQHDA